MAVPPRRSARTRPSSRGANPQRSQLHPQVGEVAHGDALGHRQLAGGASQVAEEDVHLPGHLLRPDHRDRATRLVHPAPQPQSVVGPEPQLKGFTRRHEGQLPATHQVSPTGHPHRARQERGPVLKRQRGTDVGRPIPLGKGDGSTVAGNVSVSSSIRKGWPSLGMVAGRAAARVRGSPPSSTPGISSTSRVPRSRPARASSHRGPR